MSRQKYQTLSEPMYYILLALLQEQCGVDIMVRVKEISGGRVQVGPGTLYALLDKFADGGMIEETKTEGRKRSYRITGQGKELLHREHQRLRLMVSEGDELLEVMDDEERKQQKPQ